MTCSFIVIDIMIMSVNYDGMTCCQHRRYYYCYYYQLVNYWMIVLFDIDALFTCMVGDRGGSGILVMISISNRFILSARLFTLVIIRVTNGGVFIGFLIGVKRVVWMIVVGGWSLVFVFLFVLLLFESIFIL